MAIRWIKDSQGNMVQIDTDTDKQPQQYTNVSLQVADKPQGNIVKLFNKVVSKEESPIKKRADELYAQLKAQKMAESRLKREMTLNAPKPTGLRKIKKDFQGFQKKYYTQKIEKHAKAFTHQYQAARKREKEYSNLKSVATGVGGFLFPMTGLQSRLKRKGMSRGVAGRPAGVYKHVIPGVGPVHVYEWRKWVRAQRMAVAQRALMQQQEIARRMTRRGVPVQTALQEAEMIAQQRQIEALQQARMPQQMQIPQQDYQMQPQPPIQAYRQSVRQRYPMQNVRREISFFNSNVQRFVPVNERPERWASESRPFRRGQLGVRTMKDQQGGYY